MAKRSTKKPPRKAQWERGYLSHNYWQGKVKLGEVKLGPQSEWDGTYRWQAGSRKGETKTLEEAKQAVEAVIELGDKQLGLFEE
jgi:hypothetical protein